MCNNQNYIFHPIKKSSLPCFNNELLFSVITVSFNSCGNIENTLTSVLNQKFRCFEYIVIDGGSADGTCDIIYKYIDQIDVYISEKDSGIYDAMNKGISLSRGKFLIFMNAGDQFVDHTTLDQIARIEDINSFSLIYGDYYRISENNSIYRKSRSHTAIWYGMFTSHQAMFFERDLIKSLKYNESFKIGADYDLVSKITTIKDLKIKSISMPICLFDTGGVSNRNWTKALFENWKTRRYTLSLNITICTFVLIAHIFANLFRIFLPKIYSNLRSFLQVNRSLEPKG